MWSVGCSRSPGRALVEREKGLVIKPFFAHNEVGALGHFLYAAPALTTPRNTAAAAAPPNARAAGWLANWPNRAA